MLVSVCVCVVFVGIFTQDMLEKQTLSPKKPGHGHKGVVDVVLGAQWGDEGKGKLVSGVEWSGVGMSVRNQQCKYVPTTIRLGDEAHLLGPGGYRASFFPFVNRRKAR